MAPARLNFRSSIRVLGDTDVRCSGVVNRPVLGEHSPSDGVQGVDVRPFQFTLLRSAPALLSILGEVAAARAMVARCILESLSSLRKDLDLMPGSTL